MSLRVLQSGMAAARALTFSTLRQSSARALSTTMVRLNEAAANQPIPDKNSTPTMDAKLTNFEKWLVFKFSSQKFASVNDVPEYVSKQQLYYAKDKARARMTLILIAMTILGSIGVIFIGKHEQKAGKRHADDILREHAQYSQAHRDQIRHSRD